MSCFHPVEHAFFTPVFFLQINDKDMTCEIEDEPDPLWRFFPTAKYQMIEIVYNLGEMQCTILHLNLANIFAFLLVIAVFIFINEVHFG